MRAKILFGRKVDKPYFGELTGSVLNNPTLKNEKNHVNKILILLFIGSVILFTIIVFIFSLFIKQDNKDIISQEEIVDIKSPKVIFNVPHDEMYFLKDIPGIYIPPFYDNSLPKEKLINFFDIEFYCIKSRFSEDTQNIVYQTEGGSFYVHPISGEILQFYLYDFYYKEGSHNEIYYKIDGDVGGIREIAERFLAKYYPHKKLEDYTFSYSNTFNDSNKSDLAVILTFEKKVHGVSVDKIFFNINQYGHVNYFFTTAPRDYEYAIVPELSEEQLLEYAKEEIYAHFHVEPELNSTTRIEDIQIYHEKDVHKYPSPNSLVYVIKEYSYEESFAINYVVSLTIRLSNGEIKNKKFQTYYLIEAKDDFIPLPSVAQIYGKNNKGKFEGSNAKEGDQSR